MIKSFRDLSNEDLTIQVSLIHIELRVLQLLQLLLTDVKVSRTEVI
jgi:hypothetical protein